MANYLTFDSSLRTLTLDPNNDSDVGQHRIVIKAFLADYPDQATQSSFTLKVDPCIVSKLTFIEAPANSEYMIQSGQKSLGMLNVDQGICEYEVLYEVVSEKGFVVIDEEDEIFVETEDRTLDDVHEVKLRASVEVLVDYAKTEFTKVSVEHSFFLTL